MDTNFSPDRRVLFLTDDPVIELARFLMMKSSCSRRLRCCLCGWWIAAGIPVVAANQTNQYIVLNLSNDRRAEAFAQIKQEFPSRPPGKVCLGIAGIFSYFRYPRPRVVADLRQFLRLARETDTPVVVQLDGEQWWNDRPDLWNWWDPNQPGYSPANRLNVEWTNWSPDSAIKIAWRNWGHQLRVLPPPNLMSARYRQACHQEMQVLIPIVLDWWRELPAEEKELLIGIKVGWESSIGVNAWYYPGGNELLNQPAAQDPTSGLKVEQLPARGVAQIGYAAVKTAGIQREGQITEADLVEVVRRHLEDLCREANRLGVPREKLFTHVGGWQEGELLYGAGVNSFSCPGWSFYRHAADPRADVGVQRALKLGDAPYWAAVEWLYQASNQEADWQHALTATFADSRCRYLCIYNWRGVRGNRAALDAVHALLRASAR